MHNKIFGIGFAFLLVYQTSTSPVSITACPNGQYATGVSSAGSLVCGTPSSGGIPSGSIVLINTGTCPAGFTEVSALNGKTLFGTVNANGDIGTTGGSDNITPTGTNGALTFTGTPFSSIINHTHPVTDPGHTHLTQRYPTATGTSTGFTIDTSMSGTLADNTLPTKTNTTGITTTNPAGGVASITPAGTINTPTFTGNSFDNRSAFTKVIFCSKD